MPYVPSTSPRSLIQKPSQELLSQTYGGGSFQQPPTLNANIVPNATGLINNPNTPATPGTNTATQSPAGQISGSPLATRRQPGGEADRRATRDASPSPKGQIVDRNDPLNRTVTSVVSNAMPGGSFIGAFDKLMEAFGFNHGVVGVEDVKIGDPGWESKQQIQRNAYGIDRGKALRESRMANTNRSQPRDTSEGRRGARDFGGGSMTERARNARSDMGTERGRPSGVAGGGAETGGRSNDLGSDGRHGEL